MAITSYRVSPSPNILGGRLIPNSALGLIILCLAGTTHSLAQNTSLGNDISIELPSESNDPAGESAETEPAEQSSEPSSEENEKDFPPLVSDPTAVRIVSNYINALGGEEALSNTQNIVIRAKEVSGQEEYDILIFRTATGKARVERTGFYKGRPTEFHNITDGKQFWSVDYYRNKEIPRWFDEAEMQAFLFKQSLYPQLFKHEERGVKLRYLGQENQNDIEYYVVRAYFENGYRFEYLFHPETFLVYRYRHRQRHINKNGFRTITPTRYQRINGALWELDHKIHFVTEEDLELPLGSLTVDRAEGNQRLPDEMFLPPKQKESKGAVPVIR
ncbi:MAG: hypothetical protein ACPGN3_17340 [Opitutales bacterium]